MTTGNDHQIKQPAYRLPAEWEPLDSLWISWPHQADTWPGRFGHIEPFFARWAHVIADFVSVKVLAHDHVARSAKAHLGERKHNIDLIPIATNDCWIRDYGPTFRLHRETQQLGAIDWRYNAWGGKYPPWEDDDLATAKIADQIGIPIERSNLCLEGGALETDGQDRLLVMESCLLTDSRNPGLTKQKLAQDFYQLLGVTEVVWLDGGGLVGDDTDGHIDQLARFICPQTIVVAVSDDSRDENAGGLRSNQLQLELWAGQAAADIQIIPLPTPPARFVQNKRVPESYCNFVRLGDACVLVPIFGDQKSDDQALGIFHDLCPKQQIVPIDCRELIWGLGALHCASLNQPAANS